MKFIARLKVDRELANELEQDCKVANPDMDRDITIFDEEVVFENGMVACVQVVSTPEPEKESCWTQSVLFTKTEDGFLDEVSCSEVGDSFFGEHHVEYDGNEYVVVVEVDNHIPELKENQYFVFLHPSDDARAWNGDDVFTTKGNEWWKTKDKQEFGNKQIELTGQGLVYRPAFMEVGEPVENAEGNWDVIITLIPVDIK